MPAIIALQASVHNNIKWHRAFNGDLSQSRQHWHGLFMCRLRFGAVITLGSCPNKMSPRLRGLSLQFQNDSDFSGMKMHLFDHSSEDGGEKKKDCTKAFENDLNFV